MANRKLFPKYPPDWEQHPHVLNRRLNAVEDHLEETANAPSPNSLWPAAAILLLNLLGVLGLVSPEKVAQLSKLFGH